MRKPPKTMYVSAYEFARTGMSKENVAKSLGITLKKFNNWLKDPAFADAVSRGRSAAKGLGPYEGLKEFSFGRLPAKLMQLWDEIENVDQLDLEECPDKHSRMEEVWRKMTTLPLRMRQQL